MTAPTDRNRLDDEASPYLRQHADNPVNWQPWDDQALSAARDRDVPIFLSVGYSACHWCHVMEEESFQDDEIAALLNDRFVPIKVDREERPDLDRVYQTVCQLVTGGGGWPLSAFLTPDGEPFYVGTYFPKEPRRRMPGFKQLLEDISDSWSDPEQREEMESRAHQWTAAATDRLEDTPDRDDRGEPPSSEAVDSAVSAALRSADRTHGGFGNGGPKFPHPGRIELLLDAWARSSRQDPLDVALESLDAMATGGLYDHVGGGFHRYCTDRDWTVPHFEKMLYDNAELPRVFLSGYRATADTRYALVAQETLGFLERELRHPDGGFYSTLDARSGGEEGTFYVWTPEQIRESVTAAGLDPIVADLLCDRYGVTEAGNFEGSRTVLTVQASPGDLAETHDLDVGTVLEYLQEGRLALFTGRQDRVRPGRDEKILAGWNGLAISAFAAGVRTLDPGLADAASTALSFVRDQLWNPTAGDDSLGRLSRRYKDDDVKGPGYLEDYAFLARGAFDLYQVTGDVEHLAFALDLARVIEAEFYDPERGTLYFTPASGEQLVTRPQELTDQSTPSSLGVATGLFLDLAPFTPKDDFEPVAKDVLATHANRIDSRPLEHVSLARAAAKWELGSLELTLAAEEFPEEWRTTLATRYLPAAIIAPRPPSEAGLTEWRDRLGFDEAPPIWNGRSATDGPTVYACQSFACSPPQSTIQDALDWAATRE